MTIRGGGDPSQAWLQRRPREWACRPGAAPPMRITASWSRSVGPTEYKCVARVRGHHGELPSDREITLDRTNPIQACPGAGRGLVDKDQTFGIKPALVFLPPLAPAGDVGAVLLAGVQAFF